MILYLDTSALVKKYLNESGSDSVIDILASTDYLITSALTELELTSAIERAKHRSIIDSPTYRNTVAAIEREIRTNEITLMDITGVILQIAKRLIKIRRLRPPDAIQLASAVTGHRGTQIQFISADRALLEAARLEGLRCRDVSR